METDFGTDGPDRGIGVERVAEVVQRVVRDLRVVVEQQQAVARRDPDTEVVAPGKAEVFSAAQDRDVGVAFPQYRRLVPAPNRCPRR